MNIEKLDIRGFGKIKNLKIDFIKGMNIVFGGNESGKSTIQWFIKAMLFGLKGGRTQKDGTLPPNKRFIPWQAGDYSGFMEYTLDNGESYKIGRNFDNNTVRIFDSLFNDLTDKFEKTRDRNAKFAEKHLNINETCFDKTVFIKQMESRIDDDGSKELLSRLMNISQTGTEDISFKRAEKALKEALKIYVGNDKTTTRPMDKIIARLEQLNAKKNQIIDKRNELFEIDGKLKRSLSQKEELINKQNMVYLKKEINSLEKEIFEIDKEKIKLIKIIENIERIQAELDIISKKNSKYNNEKDRYKSFSQFTREDVDNINIEYHELKTFLEENEKLESDLDKEKSNKEELKKQFEGLKIFDDLGEEIQESVKSLSKSIESFKKEHETNNCENLTNNINSLKGKQKNLKFIVTSCLLLLAISLIAGGKNPYFFLLSVASGIGVLISISLFLILKNNLKSLLSDKKIQYLYTKNTIEEIEKKESQLNDIFEKVGVDNIEDFYRLYAMHENKIIQLNSVEKVIEKLKECLEVKNAKLKGVQRNIRKKLLKANIIQDENGKVLEEHIIEFKNGINLYIGLEPSFKYNYQRINDLGENLKELYKSAYDVCMLDCDNVDHLVKKCNEYDEEIKRLEKLLNLKINELNEYGQESEVLEDFGWDKLAAYYSEKNALLEDELQNINKSLSQILLIIKEYETIISNASEELNFQEIEEEIQQLAEEKKELDDMDFSIRTALNVLIEASTEIQRDFAPELNKRMSDILDKISLGKYSDLRADDNLLIKTISPESADIVPISLLSGGTIDQVYLALRLAMTQLIESNGEQLPIIMDEIFAQYDDTRIGETLEFFNSAYENKQLILFTCKHREIEMAKEVFGGKLNIININAKSL